VVGCLDLRNPPLACEECGERPVRVPEGVPAALRIRPADLELERAS
jgi:hypothetical protein